MIQQPSGAGPQATSGRVPSPGHAEPRRRESEETPREALHSGPSAVIPTGAMLYRSLAVGEIVRVGFRSDLDSRGPQVVGQDAAGRYVVECEISRHAPRWFSRSSDRWMLTRCELVGDSDTGVAACIGPHLSIYREHSRMVQFLKGLIPGYRASGRHKYQEIQCSLGRSFDLHSQDLLLLWRRGEPLTPESYRVRLTDGSGDLAISVAHVPRAARYC